MRRGVVSIDGTRVAADASREVNYRFDQIAMEILAEDRATDEAEDEEFGEACGDELPEGLRTPEGRHEFFRQARERLLGGEDEGEALEHESEPGAAAEREYEFDPEQIVTRTPGRTGWLRAAARQLERQRWENPDPIKRSRKQRLLLAAERPEDDLGSERAGNEAYEDYRARARMRDGRRFGRPPGLYQPPEAPEGKVNITDPDSKQIPDGLAFVQGYNVQAAVSEQQIVLAAEITNASTDFSLLGPMVSATIDELRRAGIDQTPEAVAADAGYWNEHHIDEIVAHKHIPVLIAPDKGSRGTPRKTWTGGRSEWMRTVLNQNTAGSATKNEDRPSSRSSATPNTTRASPGSSEEAGSRYAPSGDY